MTKKALTPDKFANQVFNFLKEPKLDSETDSTGVQITTLHKNDNDEYEDFTGTNGQLQLRTINTNTYNGPKQEDFIALATSYYRVTIDTLEKKPNNEKEKALAIEAFENLKRDIQMLFPAVPPAEAPTIAELSDKIKIIDKKEVIMPGKISLATQKLNQLVADFSAIIEYDQIKNQDEGPATKTLQERADILREAVKAQIADDGRSNSFHLYQVPAKDDTETQRVSLVTTIGERTDPSSIRDGGYKRGIGNTPLANFVQRTYGKVVEETGQKPKIETQFSGITHSSYPPADLFSDSRFFKTAIEENIKIREIAIKGVEEVLKEFTKQAIANGQTQPIEINLTTLSLLTPMVSQMIERAIRPTVSEAKQLKEIMIALNMCRSINKLEMIGEDGKAQIIDVKLNMTHMNMPTNLGADIKTSYTVASFNFYNQYINATGFYDYCKNASDFVKKYPTGTANEDNFKKIVQVFTPPLLNLGESKTLKNEIDSKYEKLRNLQKNLELSDQNEIKLYQQNLNEIETLEEKYKNECEKINEQYKKHFIANELEAEAALNTLEQTNSIHSTEKEFVDTCRLILNARKIYYTEIYKTKEHAYDFQPLYLLSNARMGRSVEWFCKSAEDRSGVTGDRIEEHLAFRDRNGRFASTENDRQEIERELSNPVHNGSINRQVNHDNDPGGRGMQVKSKFGGEHLHFSDIDLKMSKIPKGMVKLSTELCQNTLKSLLMQSLGKTTPVTVSEKLQETTTLFNKIHSLPQQTINTHDDVKSVVAHFEQFNDYQLLNKDKQKEREKHFQASKKIAEDKSANLAVAKKHLSSLKNIFPDPTTKQLSVEDYYQAGKKGFLKATSTTPKTWEDYKALATKSTEKLKNLHSNLLEGVLYQENKKTGELKIIAPPNDSIHRILSESTQKVEVGLLVSQDRTIFLALEANKLFEPLVIEFPQGKNQTDINDNDSQLVLKTMVAAKLMGIQMSVNPQFGDFIKQNHANAFTVLEKIENLTEKELKIIQKNTKKTDLSLEELVNELEKMHPIHPAP